MVAHLSRHYSGISVGSLGQYEGEYDIVENVIASYASPPYRSARTRTDTSLGRNITMSNAQNGARIKAWAGKNVGSGIVKNITFTGFIESNVDNPVIIDQCYETSDSNCAKYPSNTYIQDIFFTECVSAVLSADKLI